MTRREGPVEYLTLNRPEVRNAFNDELIAELAGWAAAARSDRDIRVAVLSGAGTMFSSGGDAAWMAKAIAYSQEENLNDAIAVSAMFAALDSLPFPLIGRIHGAALGGGAGLAAVCDIAVAGEQTTFGFTEVKLGLIPAVIAPFVLRKIGQSAARELFLSGMRFSAGRALELRLVHAVVAESHLDATIARYVQEFLAAAPEAVAAAKALIREISDRPLEETMPVSARAIAAQRVSPVGQEGLRAFLEKRKPSWLA
jgi:methylglutaconyl-CoA hydratase